MRGLFLSSISKRGASITRFMSKKGRNDGITRNPQKQKTNMKRPRKPEQNFMMADADFTNLDILVEAATHLAENRAQKSGKRVKGNHPPSQSPNVVMNQAWVDIQTRTTSSRQQFIGMKPGESAILNDEESHERPVQLQESRPPKEFKVKTTGAVQPKDGPQKPLKVKTTGAVQPKESPQNPLKVKTTGTVQPKDSRPKTLKVKTTRAVQPKESPPKTLKVHTTGENSMVPYERVAADHSVETSERTGVDLSTISKGICVAASTKRGLHGIAVYNKSTHDWTAYIWDGERFYVGEYLPSQPPQHDDSVKTPKNTVAHSEKAPKNTGADFLEICNGVCLPDPTKLGLLGINFYKRIGRWTAHIWDGKQFYIGSYGSATEAAKAYDKASLKHLDAAAAQPNYRGIYDYSIDVKEMATMSNKQFRELLNKRARLSKHDHVEEGVTRCPEGRFEVKIKLQADKKWKFLGRFNNLEDAKRWYQMVSRWYQKQATSAGE